MESTFKEDQGQIVEAIKESVKPKVITLQDGKQVVVHQGEVIVEAKPRVRPALSRLDVETLESLIGLVPFYKADMIPGPVVRVNTPHQVILVDISEEEFHQNVVVATAQICKSVMLENYVSLEQALTEIRECFEQTQMVEELSDVLRTTKIEDITELTDNGCGMNVSVKSRVTSGSKERDSTVFNLGLTPLRTFVEVEAVPGVFTMRWKREGESIKVRLIEQDVIKWRYQQMQEIKSYLEERLPEMTILV